MKRLILILLMVSFSVSLFSQDLEIYLDTKNDSLSVIEIKTKALAELDTCLLEWYCLEPIQVKNNKYILPYRCIYNVILLGVKYKLIDEDKAVIKVSDEIIDPELSEMQIFEIEK